MPLFESSKEESLPILIVVEDSEWWLETIRSGLSGQAEVHCARTVRAAKQLIDELSDVAALIVDGSLTEQRDGVQVVHYAKQAGLSCPSGNVYSLELVASRSRRNP